MEKVFILKIFGDNVYISPIIKPVIGTKIASTNLVRLDSKVFNEYVAVIFGDLNNEVSEKHHLKILKKSK